MPNALNTTIANAADVQSSRVAAGAGLRFTSAEPVLLLKGTYLCRIGHKLVHKQPVPLSDNFISPWWISSVDFLKVLAKGQQDPSWAARVCLAIAEQWGGDCTLQVKVRLKESLYAWCGPGRAISGGRSAKAVPVADPKAYWLPEADIQQLFLPGLMHMARGRPGALWSTAFDQRECLPLLIAGNQLNLATGAAFVTPAHLPAGKRPTSI